MFGIFKKKKKMVAPKYSTHLLGTNEVHWCYSDEELQIIIDAYGADRIDVTENPLGFL